MYQRSNRDVAHRHGIAGLDRGIAAIADFVAYLDTLRGKDITALAISIKQQRQVRRAVRVVLDALDLRRNTGLVAPEIDDAITPFVATTAMTGGNTTGIVATAGSRLRTDQPRMRLPLVQIRSADADYEAATR